VTLLHLVFSANAHLARGLLGENLRQANPEKLIFDTHFAVCQDISVLAGISEIAPFSLVIKVKRDPYDQKFTFRSFFVPRRNGTCPVPRNLHRPKRQRLGQCHLPRQYNQYQQLRECVYCQCH
jgi:hypothetical protein